MARRPRTFAIAAGFGVLAVALVWLNARTGDSGVSESSAAKPVASSATVHARPTEPPAGAAQMPADGLPAFSTLSPKLRAELSDGVEGEKQPGMAAFRLLSDRYVDANLEHAREQAAAEGITLAEVRELTRFGLLVLATQRVADLEDMLGRSIDERERRALEDLMVDANVEFKRKMRELVAAGATEKARWSLIAEAEASYLAGLDELIGLNTNLVDDMLAGNLLLPTSPD